VSTGRVNRVSSPESNATCGTSENRILEVFVTACWCRRRNVIESLGSALDHRKMEISPCNVAGSPNNIVVSVTAKSQAVTYPLSRDIRVISVVRCLQHLCLAPVLHTRRRPQWHSVLGHSLISDNMRTHPQHWLSFPFFLESYVFPTAWSKRSRSPVVVDFCIGSRLPLILSQMKEVFGGAPSAEGDPIPNTTGKAA